MKNDASQENIMSVVNASIQEKEEKLLVSFFDKIGMIINNWESKIKLIIVYHPETIVLENGELWLDKKESEVQRFAELCEKNGFIFLDMSDRFLSEYAKDYILPYGFSNSSVGSGHLNKYGHEMMAEELYKLIKEAK